jgi:pyruvate formate lyase activating enzyme
VLVWLRIPIIPGVNDSPTELKSMIHLASNVPGIQQINLLPYHKTGIQKFKRLRTTYRLPNVVAPSAEYMEGIAQQFLDAGLTVKVGG